MPQGVAFGTQLALHLGATGTGAERGDQALFVEVEQAVHVGQGHRQHRARGRRRVDMSGHGRATAIGNQAQVGTVGQGQQLADLFDSFRQGHSIRVPTQGTFTQGQPVRQALTAGMHQAVPGLDAVKRVGRQPRRGHCGQGTVQAGVRQGVPVAQSLAQKRCAMGGHLHLRGFFAPAVPASHACFSQQIL